MSTLMDDEIKRWTARRKSALVLEIMMACHHRNERAGGHIFVGEAIG